MRIGQLNRRVRIERSGAGVDPQTGEPIAEWVEVATLWCNVLMKTGKESLSADAEVGQATASIRIRFRTDIDNGMRAVLLKFVNREPVVDQIFNIGEPLPDYAGREYTDLPCTSGANNGNG